VYNSQEVPMRFITVRDLRGQPRSVWEKLRQSGDLVITSNGKPVAILTATSEDKLEESLAAIRRARAMQAVSETQQESIRKGMHRTSAKQIGSIIRRSRRDRQT
jgi:antitoxin (DNA-binding transcriptional repressor) of toxin-antitoxin stability system